MTFRRAKPDAVMGDVVRSRLASLAPDLLPRRAWDVRGPVPRSAAGITGRAGSAHHAEPDRAGATHRAEPDHARSDQTGATYHAEPGQAELGAGLPVDGDATGEGTDEPPRVGTDIAPLGGRLREFGRAHVGVLLAVGLVALIWAAWTVLSARTQVVEAFAPTPELVTPAPSTDTTPGSALPSAATPEPTIVVHVIGAVARPGVVRLPEGARVADAVDAAGGFTDAARPGDLNLAEVLGDGVQIKVGDAATPGGEVRSVTPGAGAGGGGAAGGSTTGTAGGSDRGARLDLNTASATQLESLPGVGPVTAAAIVAWRTKHQRFSKIEELQEIDGIGPKTYARLAPYVRV